MADIKSINWIAGLLEGEGCFGIRTKHNPNIQLYMIDKDIVIRAAQILGAHKVIEAKKPTSGNYPIYRTIIYGTRAIGWMMTLYGLMGIRRQAKIRTCIETWKLKIRRPYKERIPYSRGAKIVWQEAHHRR